MRNRWFTWLWLAVLGGSLVHADDPPAAAAPTEPPAVIVPYDETKPVDGQEPGRVYLDYDTFQRLWKSAKDRRDQTEAEARALLGERAASLSSAMHSARVDGARLIVEARFAVLTRGPAWTAVPFAWQGAATRQLTVDGAPAALRDGNLIIEKPGLHSVVAEYEVPVAPGWTEATWSVPPAAATSLALRLAADDPARPEINGMPVVETPDGEQRVFTALLGRTDRITVRRHLGHSRAGAAPGPPPLVSTRERLFITSALERLEASATISFPDQERQEFSLRLDPGLTLVSMSIPGLRTWRLEDNGGEAQLDFELQAPVRDTLTIHWVAERTVSQVPADLAFPIFGAAAGRLERQVVFLTGDDLDVRPRPDPQWRQLGGVALTEGDSGGFSAVGAFEGSGRSPAPAYSIRPREVKRLATTRYVFQVSPGKFEVIAGVQLKPAPTEELWEAVVRMPADFTVQGVAGERLVDWWREENALHLRFGGATPEITSFTLNLTRPLPQDITTVACTPLVIDGFDSVDGSGLVVAPLGWDAVIDFDQPASVVRETSPEEANQGFAVLPPFEVKRGFSFGRGGWTASARFAAITPRFDADWVLDAEVHDGFVALNASVQLRIQQGSLTAVAFTLPASLPEVEVQGEDVREVTSAVEGAVRRYSVVLQRETNSPLRFTLSGELPHSGQAGLPDIDVPGATRIDRFLIIQNLSEGRLDLVRSGLNDCQPEELSFLPEELARSSRPAQFFRAQPGWTGTVTVESLSTTSAQAAVVLEADLTTSLLRNGDEWMRARYRLHNRSLQFLPIILPAKSQLVSVVVAGRPSRADIGAINGQPVTLVPLIQTRPGDRSVEVVIVYRLAGPAPVDGVFERTLDDPDLPGLSVQQTLWSVQLPDGYSLRQAKGPMTRVTAETWDAEKWLGRLAESASLISLTSSQTSDATIRQEALRNSSELLSEIQAAEAGNQRATKSTDAYAQVTRELKKQQEQLSYNMTAAAQQQTDTSGAKADALGRVTYKKAFVENGAAPPSAESPQSAPAQAVASQLAINDNVLWQTESTKGAAATPQQSRRRSQLGKLIDQSASPAAPSSGPAPEPLMPAEPAFQNQQLSSQQRFYSEFGNSRANAIATPVQTAQTAAPPDSRPESVGLQPATPPVAAPPAGPSTGAPQNFSPPPRQTVADAAGLAAHAAVGDVFPAQPNTVYFKKVKDRASIELTAAEPRIESRRATYLGILLGAFLLVIAADRARARIGRRAAAAT